MSDNNAIMAQSRKLLKEVDKAPRDAIRMHENQFDILRSDIVEFFREVMGEVKKKQNLKELIEDSFVEDIHSGELDFQSRMSLYKLISTQSNVTIDSIISLFKPTPGAPSLLADQISKDKDKSLAEDVYDSMSPDDLQNVQKLMSFMSKMMEDAKE